MLFFFFFNDTATTEIYTLSLHDALPIYQGVAMQVARELLGDWFILGSQSGWQYSLTRSEEHTSELQSPCNLVCRLLLEKKKKTPTNMTFIYIYLTLFIPLCVSITMHT